MSKKKIGLPLLVIAMGWVAIIGCTKTVTVLEDNTPAVTKTVSFSKDLVPILGSSCAKSGCHSGSVAPNLSSATAYSALVNGNYINIATPEKSIVYLWLTGKEAAAMPLGSSNNPSNINGLMLAWIKQGAKNN
ncbi:MAG: hypothetical protein JST58_16555 [Bacteroidetes bacterium]|nr:hypothetical protein [Bacteroidota bacterium]